MIGGLLALGAIGPHATETETLRDGHATEAGTYVSAVEAEHLADQVAISRAARDLAANPLDDLAAEVVSQAGLPTDAWSRVGDYDIRFDDTTERWESYAGTPEAAAEIGFPSEVEAEQGDPFAEALDNYRQGCEDTAEMPEEQTPEAIEACALAANAEAGLHAVYYEDGSVGVYDSAGRLVASQHVPW